MDNESAGLAAYVDQQFAAAAGGGNSEPIADESLIASGLDQESVAPNPDETDDALSGTGVGPDGETASAPDPEATTSAASDDDAVREELARLRAERAERERKDLEAERARVQAESVRRQQEFVAQVEQEFSAFEEYEAGLGRKAKDLTSRVAGEVARLLQADVQAANQAAEANGRSFAALIQALRATVPAELANQTIELAKTVLPLNGPEEQGKYISLLDQRSKAAVAAQEKELARLREENKRLHLQAQARGVIDSGKLAVGSGGTGQVVGGNVSEPANFSDWFDQKRAEAMSGAR